MLSHERIDPMELWNSGRASITRGSSSSKDSVPRPAVRTESSSSHHVQATAKRDALAACDPEQWYEWDAAGAVCMEITDMKTRMFRPAEPACCPVAACEQFTGPLPVEKKHRGFTRQLATST